MTIDRQLLPLLPLPLPLLLLPLPLLLLPPPSHLWCDRDGVQELLLCLTPALGHLGLALNLQRGRGVAEAVSAVCYVRRRVTCIQVNKPLLHQHTL
jgi:hypothetical protein